MVRIGLHGFMRHSVVDGRTNEWTDGSRSIHLVYLFSKFEILNSSKHSIDDPAPPPFQTWIPSDGFDEPRDERDWEPVALLSRFDYVTDLGHA